MAAAKTHSESSLPVLPRGTPRAPGPPNSSYDRGLAAAGPGLHPSHESVWAVTVAVALRPVSAGRGGMAVHGAASTRARARAWIAPATLSAAGSPAGPHTDPTKRHTAQRPQCTASVERHGLGFHGVGRGHPRSRRLRLRVRARCHGAASNRSRPSRRRSRLPDQVAAGQT